MQNEKNDTTGRKQRTRLLLDAPVELVWEVFTKSEHIQQWWELDGFTNAIEKMQVEAGGEWVFTMHEPVGNHYPNSTLFSEVVTHRKIVHKHIDPNFTAIIEFENRGNQTMLNCHKLYETKELFEMIEKHHKTIEGFKQTVERLILYFDQNKKKIVSIK